MTPYHIRDGAATDLDALLQLLPRLADFELPPRRDAEHLWRGDAKLLDAWSRGTAPQCVVRVAVDPAGTILGAAIAQLRDELLSHAPSAHLEALMVRPDMEGKGIGQSLLRSMEQAVDNRGAESVTLHVFNSNTKARAIYEKHDYSAELIRYIKHLR